jgi:phospholipase/carboxylesterase
MNSIVVQHPTQPSQQLFLLFHGLGADPSDLKPLGDILAKNFPAAMVVCVAAPQNCDFASGLQWFSVLNMSEENRAQRVAQVLPNFFRVVQHWQHLSRVSPSATALIGFSQGAMMALEASKHQPFVAGRIIAHSGRFITLPSVMSELSSIHLIHGKLDDVVPYHHTLEAAQALQTIGADFTADVVPHLAHIISPDTVTLILKRLQSHVPKRLWNEALKAAKTLPH